MSLFETKRLQQQYFPPEVIEAFSGEDSRAHVEALEAWFEREPRASMQIYNYFGMRSKGLLERVILVGFSFIILTNGTLFLGVMALKSWVGYGHWTALITTLLVGALMASLLFALTYSQALVSKSGFERKLVSAMLEAGTADCVPGLVQVLSSEKIRKQQAVALKLASLLDSLSVEQYQALPRAIKMQLYQEASGVIRRDMNSAKIQLKIACLRLFERAGDRGAIISLLSLLPELKIAQLFRFSPQFEELKQAAESCQATLNQASKPKKPAEARLLRAADPGENHQDLLRASNAAPDMDNQRLLRVNAGELDENSSAE